MAKSNIPIEQLLADLHQADFMTRCNAARELGKTRDPRAVEALLGDLSDKDWRVRRNAAQALGAAKAKNAVEPLILALSDRTMTVRLRAVVALGRIKDPRAIPALLTAVRVEGGDIYNAAVDALKKFGKACLPAVMADLLSAEPDYQDRLLPLLQAIPCPEAVEPLSRILAGDAKPITRANAADALAATGSPLALEPLLAALSDPDWMVCSSAARALGRTRDPRVVPHLLTRLVEPDLNSGNAELHRSIALACQQLAGFAPSFGDILQNDVVAMVGLLGDEHQQYLKTMLDRYSALFQDLSSPESAGGPASRAFDRNLDLIAQMRGAKYAASRKVEDLMGLLSAPNALVRISAAITLAWYRDPRALAALNVATLDPDPDVRTAACWAHETLVRALR